MGCCVLNQLELMGECVEWNGVCVRVLPVGKKPCSWNSCMTSALL